MTLVYTDSQFGIVGGPNNDNTAALQAAFNIAAAEGATLILTQDIRVNPTGILVPSNTNVIFEDQARIKLLPSNSNNYDILALFGCNNVSITNANIDGSNAQNSADPSLRVGIGIAIAGATNVTLDRPKIKDCWGDGLYIRGSYSSGNAPPSGLKVFAPRIRGCGRDAVSVVSANGLTISDLLGESINTAAPMALIDFEPNGNTDVLENIVVMGAKSVNCQEGLRFSFQNLPGAVAQTVGITVSGYTDVGCLDKAVYWTALTKGSFSVSGSININNPTFVHSNSTTSNSSWDNSVVVTVNNPTTVA